MISNKYFILIPIANQNYSDNISIFNILKVIFNLSLNITLYFTPEFFIYLILLEFFIFILPFSQYSNLIIWILAISFFYLNFMLFHLDKLKYDSIGKQFTKSLFNIGSVFLKVLINLKKSPKSHMFLVICTLLQTTRWYIFC